MFKQLGVYHRVLNNTTENDYRKNDITVMDGLLCEKLLVTKGFSTCNPAWFLPCSLDPTTNSDNQVIIFLNISFFSLSFIQHLCFDENSTIKLIFNLTTKFDWCNFGAKSVTWSPSKSKPASFIWYFLWKYDFTIHISSSDNKYFKV